MASQFCGFGGLSPRPAPVAAVLVTGDPGVRRLAEGDQGGKLAACLHLGHQGACARSRVGNYKKGT